MARLPSRLRSFEAASRLVSTTTTAGGACACACAGACVRACVGGNGGGGGGNCKCAGDRSDRSGSGGSDGGMVLEKGELIGCMRRHVRCRDIRWYVQDVLEYVCIGGNVSRTV